MSLFGASPSLCHSQGDRVFCIADTTRLRTLIQYRFALQRGWHERQVSEVEIFDQVRPGRPKMKFNHRARYVNSRAMLTLFGPPAGATICFAQKGFCTFYSP